MSKSLIRAIPSLFGLKVPPFHRVSAKPDGRFGSKPDERGHRPGGPHLGVKQTKSGAKQTLPLEGLLSGEEQTFC